MEQGLSGRVARVLLVVAILTTLSHCSAVAMARPPMIGPLIVLQAMTPGESEKTSVPAKSQRSEAEYWLKRGELRRAIAAYRSAIASNGRDMQSFYGLAVALDGVRALGEERVALERVVQLDSSFAPARNQLGLLDMREGKNTEAETELKEALTLDPHYAEAKNNLGVLMLRLGENAKAEEWFRQAIVDETQYVQAMVNLGSLQASEGRFAEAHEALGQAISAAPRNVDALTEDAMVLMKMNRGSDAVAAFRTAVGLEPKRAGIRVDLGIALADTGDLPGALAEFTQAVRLDPRSGIAHYNRGRVLGDLHRDVEAKAELETAVRLNANEAEWWSTLASTARTTDDEQERLRGLRMAAALEPRSARRRSELGQALQEMGDRNGAIVQWREALSIDPGNREALYALSRALMRTQPEEAQRMQARLRDLISLERATDESQTMGNDALNAAASGDWSRAISQLRAAIERCGECSAGPLLHKDLGLVYCRSGDLKSGERELLEAKKMMPEDKDIARTLEIIGSRAR